MIFHDILPIQLVDLDLPTDPDPMGDADLNFIQIGSWPLRPAP